MKQAALSLLLAWALIGALVVVSHAPGANAFETDKKMAIGSKTVLDAVSPALQQYADDAIAAEWRQPDLSTRDRSIATIAALIARNQVNEERTFFALALNHGVKPIELSEIITHLAFYSGWANATAAAAAAGQVFAERGIGIDQLPAISPKPLPLDDAAETDRATRVGAQFGSTSPGLVENTTNVLFRNLWLRPDLAPRDRSLVTVSALVASGQAAQIGYHLNRAMDNGLTQKEAGALLSHLAFYAGWPNAFSAAPIFKDVFEKRATSPR